MLVLFILFADSRWVSPVHCVPKKGGITVVPNENNKLIPQRVAMFKNSFIANFSVGLRFEINP
jgi:hypothetical protein